MEWLSNFYSNFHFLRPLWLFMLIPCLWCCYRLWQQRTIQTGFEQVIDADLLAHLATGENKQPALLPYIGLALLWCLGTVAMAGPTWKQQPLPVYQSQSAVIIVLDLSPSMLATDIKPSRIVRAKLKIRNLLEQRQDGLTALIVYAGEAYVVTPLSEDTDTIIHLLPTLTPGLLPIAGSNIEMAVSLANQLVEDVGIANAHLVIFTDGVDTDASTAIHSNTSLRIDSLSILGVGTANGAPIPHEHGFLQNSSGEFIMASVDIDQLEAIAKQNGGIYRSITNTDGDIKQINRFISNKDQYIQQARNIRYQQFDRWQEFGPYLLLLSLPFAALCFRRGWLLPAILAVILLPPKPAYGFDWQDLWLRKDQQGQRAFQKNNYKSAAEAFKNPQWRAGAYYRNGNFATAADIFAGGDTAVDYYNRGNALAKQGKLAEAIEAYDQALTKAPEFEDAQFNRNVVEQLLQQQTAEEQAQQNTTDSSGNQHNQQGDSQQSEQQSSQPTLSQKKNNQTSDHQMNHTEQSEQQIADSHSKSINDKDKEDFAKEEERANKKHSAKNENTTKEDSSNGEQREVSKEEEAQVKQQQGSIVFDEQQQSYEQLLRKVPDDPSGLLRRKFNYQHQLRQKQYLRGEWRPPENDAHRRY